MFFRFFVAMLEYRGGNMALISCPECEHEVSTQAENCPKCGCPISSVEEIEKAGVATTTTQLTSKKLKLKWLYSFGMIVVGFLVAVIGSASFGDGGTVLGLLIGLAGALRCIYIKIMIWWHHE